MTHDLLIDLLASVLTEEVALDGCMTVLAAFSSNPGAELAVSIPICDKIANIPLKDFVQLREWKNFIEKSAVTNVGDLIDYLCICEKKRISLEISPESLERLYVTLINICYNRLSYGEQVYFWRYVIENNSLANDKYE